MFRLLKVIIRPSNELTQDYPIPSALWDPVALKIVGAIVLWVNICYYSVYGYLCYYVTMTIYTIITYMYPQYYYTKYSKRFGIPE